MPKLLAERFWPRVTVGRCEKVAFPEVGRPLLARLGTSDRRSIDDARTGRFHLPPDMMSAPSSVLDVGANVGATALHYQALWPAAKVVAVEPDPDTRAVLRRNVERHPAPHPFVRSFAVSTGFGGCRWLTDGLDAEAYRLDPAGGQIVYCVTLGHAIGYDFGDACDLVKLDVEGEEWRLFEHGSEWAPMVRCLLVELHALGAPDPPPEPWPEGRDGPSPLLAAAIPLLEGLGFDAVPHAAHPHAVWATR